MDNRQYWGHAFTLLRRGEQFLMDHVPIPGRVVPGKMVREDYPLYPPLATREAIANAICHRDYTQPSAVALAMYDDHLEVINPGVLNFGITPEKLILPHESKPWNPIIANVFYRAGIIEEWGTGTINILDWCKSNGNPKPNWEIRTQSVVMTFLPSQFYATGKMETDTQPAKPLRVETLEDTILKLLQNGPLSRTEIARHLGHKQISGRVKKIIYELLEKQIIATTMPHKPISRLQKYKIYTPPK
jgi:ATP-dependent DNA helicase RecG